MRRGDPHRLHQHRRLYGGDRARRHHVASIRGQTEAAQAIGMTHWQTMIHVVLPQAMRNIAALHRQRVRGQHQGHLGAQRHLRHRAVLQVQVRRGHLYTRTLRPSSSSPSSTSSLTFTVTRLLRLLEKKMDGPDNYVIHGSQSDSRAAIQRGTGEGATHEHGKRSIDVRHLSKTFGDAQGAAGHRLFRRRKGEVVCIIGSSGSGKSHAAALHQPAGDADWRRDPLPRARTSHPGNVDLTQTTAPRVGMVFQQFNLFNNMTVLENCVVGQMKVLKRDRRGEPRRTP